MRTHREDPGAVRIVLLNQTDVEACGAGETSITVVRLEVDGVDQTGRDMAFVDDGAVH